MISEDSIEAAWNTPPEDVLYTEERGTIHGIVKVEDALSVEASVATESLSTVPVES